MTREALLSIVRPFGQEHLLAFWDRLDSDGQASLARQIEAIGFALVRRLYEGRNQQRNVCELVARAEPPPAFRLDPAQNPFSLEQARRRAAEAIRAGQVGVILVAGGQGTRLGFDHPKGMFPIGPVSNKTLFQIHVEKIVAAARRYGVQIPLYLMTSPATHDETVAFFADHGRFGLPADDLFVFCQGTMPAVDDRDGRVLLESPGRIATSPDGHGGLLAAMHRSGALDDADRRGIRHLFYFQVDNPLVDICGLDFLGYHLLSNSELSSQVIAKRDPLERVGNVVQVDGRLMVIEYSDLPDEAANRRNPDGSLAIWAGSIAVHVIDAGLLRRMGTEEVVGENCLCRKTVSPTTSSVPLSGLPFHIAHKKVAHINAVGNRIEPKEPNAIKFERFIFDLMPQARNAIVVEVNPRLAFAPLKNASGAKEDTPESVRRQMSDFYGGWLRQAGADVAADATVEISPLYALDVEQLKTKIRPGTQIVKPTYFGD
jgi:UDP-N-acetylglucosamine/UDP-N-acetylgalactosamine diphosphorylase